MVSTELACVHKVGYLYDPKQFIWIAYCIRCNVYLEQVTDEELNNLDLDGTEFRAKEKTSTGSV